MSDNKWVYRVSDGQWCLGACPSPAIYNTDQVNYGIADLGAGAPIPNPRTQKWNGSASIARTQAEIDAYDSTQPKLLDARDVMRRLSASTHLRLEQLAQTDATTAKLWNTLKAGRAEVDVNSAEFQQGAAYLKSVGIPSVWADEAAYTAEMATVMA